MIVLTTKQNPDKFMFFIKIPDKILQKLFKCKTCPVKLSLCFLQFFSNRKIKSYKNAQIWTIFFFLAWHSLLPADSPFFIACRKSVSFYMKSQNTDQYQTGILPANSAGMHYRLFQQSSVKNSQKSTKPLVSSCVRGYDLWIRSYRILKNTS